MPAEPALELMTVELHGSPTLAAAAKSLGVAPADIDATYGVVPVDPDRGLFAVRVKSGAIPASPEEAFHGPFADPKIAPFGFNEH
jgi:hypothetical protein